MQSISNIDFSGWRTFHVKTLLIITVIHTTKAVVKVSHLGASQDMTSHTDQLPDGLIAQLVEHCTCITEVTDSNPVQA